MKKIIYLIIALCLYSSSIVAYDLNHDIVEKEVNPKDIDINEAWILLNFENEYLGTAKIYFDYNKLLL